MITRKLLVSEGLCLLIRGSAPRPTGACPYTTVIGSRYCVCQPHLYQLTAIRPSSAWVVTGTLLVPKNFCSQKQKFHRWNFHSSELLFPGTLVPLELLFPKLKVDVAEITQLQISHRLMMLKYMMLNIIECIGQWKRWLGWGMQIFWNDCIAGGGVKSGQLRCQSDYRANRSVH